MTLQQRLDHYQQRIREGSLDPNMPAFILIGQDAIAANTIRYWATKAEECGVPPHKSDGAFQTADEFDNWPVKQIPGLPQTRTDISKG